MTINFPNAPTEYEEYSAQGYTWVFVNGRWASYGAGGTTATAAILDMLGQPILDMTGDVILDMAG